MHKSMRNNTRKTKTTVTKYCALLDKPCMGEQCAQYYNMFEKCTFELIPYNMYPLTVSIQELTEINHEFLDVINELLSVIKEKGGTKGLFK